MAGVPTRHSTFRQPTSRHSFGHRWLPALLSMVS
jgi:hypothetical protein